MKNGPASEYTSQCAERLRIARSALNKTQEEISYELGVDQPRYAKWETSILPSVYFISKLKSMYGIDPNWVYCGDMQNLPDKLRSSIIGIQNGSSAPNKRISKRKRSDLHKVKIEVDFEGHDDKDVKRAA